MLSRRRIYCIASMENLGFPQPRIGRGSGGTGEINFEIGRFLHLKSEIRNVKLSSAGNTIHPSGRMGRSMSALVMPMPEP